MLGSLEALSIILGPVSEQQGAQLSGQVHSVTGAYRMIEMGLC